MNEYTRREEVRSTLIAAAALVLAVGAAIVLLMTAQGAMVPDETARAAAKTASEKATQAQACAVAAEKLHAEIDVFKGAAKAARLSAQEPDAGAPNKRRPPRPSKDKEPDVELAWGSAQPSYKQAKALAPCRALIEGASGAKADAAPGWDAVVNASAVAPPAEGDKKAQVDATRKLLQQLGEAPVDKVLASTREAAASLKTASEAAAKTADGAMVRASLPKGLLPRELALVVGVILCLAGLLLSYLSVRFASGRRMATLMPLRRAGQPGMQAAAILQLAAQPNGGEPGMVIGAAVGGLLAAALARTDADLFALGVMTGLLLGLLVQFVVRNATVAASWRRRAKDLGDIEKPQIPIVLALSGVNPGMEASFLKFFLSLSPMDAAATVEKLAMQAEEKILAAAEAGAARQQQQAQGYPPPPGYPG